MQQMGSLFKKVSSLFKKTKKKLSLWFQFQGSLLIDSSQVGASPGFPSSCKLHSVLQMCQ